MQPHHDQPNHAERTRRQSVRSTVIALGLIAALLLSACDTNDAPQDQSSAPPLGTDIATTLMLELVGGDLLLPLRLEIDVSDGAAAVVVHSAHAQPEREPAPGAVGLSSQSAAAGAVSANATIVRPVPEPQQVLVRYHDEVPRPLAGPFSASLSLQREHDLELVDRVADGVNVLRIPANADLEQVLHALRLDPRVAVAEPNHVVRPLGAPALLPNDPELAHQWGLFRTGTPSAWPNATGEGVVVAVIDSGFDLDHPDMVGRYLPGFDFCAGSDGWGNCVGVDDDPRAYLLDFNHHGTHVASIISSATDNGLQTAGVAPNARILPIKVLNEISDEYGEAVAGGNLSALVDALRWAAGLHVHSAPANPNPAQIINISLGGPFSSTLLQTTIDAVRAQGVTVIASAGNHDPNWSGSITQVVSPAAKRGVIAVGSTGTSFYDYPRARFDASDLDARSDFSNYGSTTPYGDGGLALMAPGAAVVGHMLASAPFAQSGTSMAGPHVAGAVALLLSRDPHLSPDDVAAALFASTYFDASSMDAEYYGAGNLRVDGLLGLPAPRTPDDRTVTLTISSAETITTVTLDLLTGVGTPTITSEPPTGTTTIELRWNGHTYRSTLELP